MMSRTSLKLFGLAGLVLVTLALFPLAWAFPTFPGDERALMELQDLQSGWLDNVALAVSSLGVVPVSVALLFAVSVVLFVLRRRCDALIVLLALVPIIVGGALKVIVERPRPDYLLAGSAPGGLSFPSGHSLFALLIGGILIFQVGEMVKAPLVRRWLQIALGLLILAVGVSRVYLGVHWPSDVIGGYLFGGVALLGLIMMRNMMLNAR